MFQTTLRGCSILYLQFMLLRMHHILPFVSVLKLANLADFLHFSGASHFYRAYREDPCLRLAGSFPKPRGIFQEENNISPVKKNKVLERF